MIGRNALAQIHQVRPTGGVGKMVDRYSQQGNRAFEAWLEARTAAREAGFFVPHLRPGMRALDVGCGPGGITVGLAEVVAPGEVVGIDLQLAAVKRARGLAEKQGIPNARFGVGDVYRLPFPAGLFDAIPAHGVVMHLREGRRAITLTSGRRMRPPLLSESAISFRRWRSSPERRVAGTQIDSPNVALTAAL